jgi:hypothetical protein
MKSIQYQVGCAEAAFVDGDSKARAIGRSHAAMGADWRVG